MQHQVRAMEHYVATDERPADKCITDVKKSDLYIGLFAWRYGYVPPNDNPQKRSVTELEYRAAEDEKKPRLIFLLDPAAAWQPDRMDSHTGEGDSGARIRDLRKELQTDSTVAFFTSPEDLASRVAAAVHVAGALEQASDVKVDLGAVIQSDIVDQPEQLFSSSGILMLAEGLMRAGSAQLITIDLQRNDYWWSTRLFALVTLAQEFTPVEWLLFVEGGEQYVGMARPIDVRRALALAQPELESDYRSMPLPNWGRASPPHVHAGSVLGALVEQFNRRPGGEKGLRFIVSAQWIRDHVAGLDRTLVESSGPIDPLAVYLMLEKQTPFVPMAERGKLLKVIDRVGVATEIAQQHLKRQLSRA
jgi:hypothetical protein